MATSNMTVRRTSIRGSCFYPKSRFGQHNDMERVKKMARPYLEELSNTFQVSAKASGGFQLQYFTIKILIGKCHYILLTRLNTTFALNATASKLLLYYMGERQRERYFQTLDQPDVYEKYACD